MNEYRSEGILVVEQRFCGLKGCFLSDILPEAPPRILTVPTHMPARYEPTITLQELSKQILLPPSCVAADRDLGGLHVKIRG